MNLASYPSLHSSAKQELLVGGQFKVVTVLHKVEFERLWKIVQSWFCFFFFSSPWKNKFLSSIFIWLLTEILQNGSCLAGTVVFRPKKPTSAWAVWLCPMEPDAWCPFRDVKAICENSCCCYACCIPLPRLLMSTECWFPGLSIKQLSPEPNWLERIKRKIHLIFQKRLFAVWSWLFQIQTLIETCNL